MKRFSQVFFLLLICSFSLNLISCPLPYPEEGFLFIEVFDSLTIEPLDKVEIKVSISKDLALKKYSNSDGRVLFDWYFGSEEIIISCKKDGYLTEKIIMKSDIIIGNIYKLEIGMKPSDLND